MGTEFQYREAISPGEMNSLRASVGFRQIDPRQLEAGLRGGRGTNPWALADFCRNKSQIRPAPTPTAATCKPFFKTSLRV